MATADKQSNLLRSYRESAKGTGNRTLHEANNCHDRMHASYRQLRETEEGRIGVVVLMDDDSPHVRCWAATHSLAGVPGRARLVLEAPRDQAGSCSVDAEMVLKEFNRGRLNFNY